MWIFMQFDELRFEKRHNIPIIKAIIAQFNIVAEKKQIVKIEK